MPHLLEWFAVMSEGIPQDAAYWRHIPTPTYSRPQFLKSCSWWSCLSRTLGRHRPTSRSSNAACGIIAGTIDHVVKKIGAYTFLVSSWSNTDTLFWSLTYTQISLFGRFCSRDCTAHYSFGCQCPSPLFFGLTYALTGSCIPLPPGPKPVPGDHPICCSIWFPRLQSGIGMSGPTRPESKTLNGQNENRLQKKVMMIRQQGKQACSMGGQEAVASDWSIFTQHHQWVSWMVNCEWGFNSSVSFDFEGVTYG